MTILTILTTIAALLAATLATLRLIVKWERLTKLRALELDYERRKALVDAERAEKRLQLLRGEVTVELPEIKRSSESHKLSTVLPRQSANLVIFFCL